MSTKMAVTHAKISQLVASLPTSGQQVVFKLLVPSCQQVCNKVLTIYNNLVDTIRNIVTTLFRQSCNILVISTLYQTRGNNLATSSIMPASFFQTCCLTTGNVMHVRTQLTDNLCEQICNNLLADL